MEFFPFGNFFLVISVKIRIILLFAMSVNNKIFYRFKMQHGSNNCFRNLENFNAIFKNVLTNCRKFVSQAHEIIFLRFIFGRNYCNHFDILTTVQKQFKNNQAFLKKSKVTVVWKYQIRNAVCVLKPFYILWAILTIFCEKVNEILLFREVNLFILFSFANKIAEKSNSLKLCSTNFSCELDKIEDV